MKQPNSIFLRTCTLIVTYIICKMSKINVLFLQNECIETPINELLIFLKRIFKEFPYKIK